MGKLKRSRTTANTTRSDSGILAIYDSSYINAYGTVLCVEMTSLRTVSDVRNKLTHVKYRM